MRFITLRSIPKISSNVVQNYCRAFSYKFEMTPATRGSTEHQEPEPMVVPEGESEISNVNTNFRYSVCQQRTSPVDKPSTAGNVVEAQKQTVKAAIEQQHLQPAMLPEYYQKQMEKNVLISPEPEPNEQDRIQGNQAPGRFQVSKTYANAILPLKSVKLANPFPEPVKMMMSRTVSDDEKAEQMLAESRTQRAFSDWSRMPGNPQSRTYSTTPRRWYSKTVGRDSEKCKKFPGSRAGCPNLRLPNCEGPKSKSCERIPKQINCKKQEAPYPAYSEFCHEEIEERPSECKMCPWKAEENPNFKPPKKSFHTSGFPLNFKRSGLEIDKNEMSKRAEDVEAKILAPKADEESLEGMYCDLRKPSCERPKNRRCPLTEKEKKEKKEQERKKKEEQKKCASANQMLVDQDMLPETAILTEETIEDNIMSLKKGPCKIPRFKFPKCGPPKKEDQHTRCPKPKRKRPLVSDCPPDEKCASSVAPTEIEYQMAKKTGKKCPQIDHAVQKIDDDDDPCRLKRKGTTKICPADLLKRKRRRPKKKTSGLIAPIDSKKDPPQQPTTRTM